MDPAEFATALQRHSGHFVCERIGAPSQTRHVAFRHVVTAPEAVELPAGIGGLDAFYRCVGSVRLYHHDASGDAARFIAPVSQWPALRAELEGWTASAGDDDEGLPDWLESALVIGEVPATGNYILVAAEGERAGHVFEFDHDGFEFSERAPGLVAYVERWLQPDNTLLVDMASHMRFVDGEPHVQWWIREMHDAGGPRASTAAE